MSQAIILVYSDLNKKNAIREVVQYQRDGLRKQGYQVFTVISNRASHPNDNETPDTFYLGDGIGSQVLQLLSKLATHLPLLIQSSVLSLIARIKDFYQRRQIANIIQKIKSQHVLLGIVIHNYLSLAHLHPQEKVLSYYHSFRFVRIKSQLLQTLPYPWQIAERSCVFGEAMAQELNKKSHIPRSLIRLIDNPISEKALQEKVQQAWSASYKKTLPKSYFIHASRFIPRKRHDLLLQAYKKSGVDTPLILIGDGALAESIREQIQLLGLKDKVFMLGFIENPYPLIAQAKGVLLCSDHEGMPMILLEALALGVPVISTDCPTGPREILGEFHPQALSPVDNIDAFAESIRWLDHKPYSVNPKLIQQFSVEKHCQSLLTILTDDSLWNPYP